MFLFWIKSNLKSNGAMSVVLQEYTWAGYTKREHKTWTWGESDLSQANTCCSTLLLLIIRGLAQATFCSQASGVLRKGISIKVIHKYILYGGSLNFMWRRTSRVRTVKTLRLYRFFICPMKFAAAAAAQHFGKSETLMDSGCITKSDHWMQKASTKSDHWTHKALFHFSQNSCIEVQWQNPKFLTTVFWSLL